jgi:hypothetical protein
MIYKNCNCNPPSVISSIIGERHHIDNERGEWCAIINENGIYLQNLVVPSEKEILDEQNNNEKIALEQSENTAKENRIIESKSQYIGAK